MSGRSANPQVLGRRADSAAPRRRKRDLMRRGPGYLNHGPATSLVPVEESSADTPHASRMASWQPRVVPMTVRFELFPADLDATADFYTRVLGFSLVSDQRGAKNPCLALERDDVRIGAAARPDHGHRDHRQPPTGVELVLEVNDLDAEHRHVVASGWPLAADLQQRPWGQRDFRLLDPSGYYLRVTSRKVQA